MIVKLEINLLVSEKFSLRPYFSVPITFHEILASEGEGND